MNYSPTELTFSRNVVWPSDGNQHVQLPSAADVTAMDDNWYIPGNDPACNIHSSSLAEWQSSTSFDANSSCSSVPGIDLPTQVEVDDFNQWTSQTFLDHFRPDSSWPGCSANMGAFDCTTGKLRVKLEPIPGYTDNNGSGWAGPLIVRQRYTAGS